MYWSLTAFCFWIYAFMAACAPSFNATPGDMYLSVFPNASSVTLVWDYNPDGETVKYVELYTKYRSWYFYGWPWLYVYYEKLVARKAPNQPLYVDLFSGYRGRVAFSGKATFTILNITQGDSYEYRFVCRVSFNSTIHPLINSQIYLAVAGKSLTLHVVKVISTSRKYC